MEKFTPKDHAEEVALFKSEVIGVLSRQVFRRGELRAELRSLSERAYRPPGSVRTRSYAASTLERWYYQYKNHGLDGLKPRRRNDAGRCRQLTDEQRQLLCDVRREFPHASASLILRTLVLQGRLDDDAVTASTLRRLYQREGLDRIPLRDGKGGKTRLRWEAERPGALWHGDVCYGPSIEVDGKQRPVRIHGMLDDASRFVVALEAHHTEREQDMLGLLVRTIRREGVPDALYLDNGSTYRGDILRVVCGRLGIALLHARPRDPQARGKMERFWRTLREGCLDFCGGLSSLHELNLRLWAFLDEHYHQAPHASLMGQAPSEVYRDPDSHGHDDIDEDKLRTALTTRVRRRVRRDSTVALDGFEWELDQGFLAGRTVTVARCLIDPRDPPWVEHDDSRFELHPIDAKANAYTRRPPRREPEPPPPAPTGFDPAQAFFDKFTGKRPNEGSDV